MSSTHRAWHRGLMLLEREALTVPRLVSSPAFLELRAPQLVSEQLAVEYLESLMDSVIERLTNLKPGDTLTSITPALYMETREWEKNWVK
uniref:Uncharacterized protein n=1 Tax=Parascaris equorum TaxID=6256 RepID=A0A914RN62_PAREQ